VSVDLSKFDLISVSFEAKFPGCPLLWDRAGSIWNQIMKKYPQLSVDTAAPQETKVNIDKNSVGVVASDRAACTITGPNSDLRELRELASVLYPAVFDHLEIKALTRIGLLLQFSKTFALREEAADFVLSQVPVPRSRPG
jgi:hypothetical protein